MPLSTVFQSYHGDSLHHSCVSWVSPVLGWGSEVSCPRTLPRKTQRILCGLNPGTLDYESNTLPLCQVGPPRVTFWLGFADHKINVTKNLKFVFRRVENIVDKEKMLVTSIFSFSHNVFKRLHSQSH